jgi:acyl-CoA synthetase (AMP-forming)/AMP-acid ligase II
MFHVYGLNIVNMPFLYAGGKLVSLPGFEPKTFINALEEYKVRRDDTQHTDIQHIDK